MNHNWWYFGGTNFTLYKAERFKIAPLRMLSQRPLRGLIPVFKTYAAFPCASCEQAAFGRGGALARGNPVVLRSAVR